MRQLPSRSGTLGPGQTVSGCGWRLRRSGSARQPRAHRSPPRAMATRKFAAIRGVGSPSASSHRQSAPARSHGGRHGAAGRCSRRAAGERPGGGEGRPTVLFRQESQFNPLVAVVELPEGQQDGEFGTYAGSRILVLDNNPVAHSIWRPGQVFTGGYWDIAGLLPLVWSGGMPPGLPVGMYGLGGGSSCVVLCSLYRHLRVHAWDICPAIVESSRFMGLQPFLESGQVVANVGDAFSEQSVAPGGQKFAGLICDCFLGEDSPPQLMQEEVWASIWGRVAPGGVLMVNLGDHPDADDTARGLTGASARVLAALAAGVREDRLLQLQTSTKNAIVLVAEHSIDWVAVRAVAPAEVQRFATGWTTYADFKSRQ